MTNRQLLHAYALFVTGCTFLLIVAGGLVTSTDSGLSVPDWPLSYGQVFPPMVGGIRFEHTHRVIAGIVGILTLILALLAFKKEPRGWAKALAGGALLAVIIQAVLGGITVLYFLPKWVSVTHACLAQTFFSLLAAFTLFTSREWAEAKPVESEQATILKHLFFVTTLFVYLQLIVGAMVRHGDPKDPIINAHYTLAFLIFTHALFILFRVAKDAEIQAYFLKHIAILVSLITLQVFLGLGSLILTRFVETQFRTTQEVLITTAHQAGGALILVTSLLLTLRAYRLLRQAPEAGGKGSIRDYIALTKPRLTLMAVATALLGFYMASDPPLDIFRLIGTLGALFLVGGGASALNQFFEMDVDGKMARTKNRPLPSGRLSSRLALVFGATNATLGIVYLLVFVNVLTGLLAILTLSSYLFLYTPLKRKTPLNTLVGAVPGALPVVMGWTAARGTLNSEAAVLFVILFIWQLPHFLAIAWVYREDYERSGLRMIKEGGLISRQIVLYCLMLLPVTLLPAFIFAGDTYFMVALAANVAFLVLALSLFFRKLAKARQFVSASILYLLVLVITMMVDKIHA